MAALLVDARLDVAAHHSLGHFTHEKSSVGCAAALATIDTLLGEGLLARAEVIGARLQDRLQALQMRVPLVGEVRRAGALLGVELTRPDGSAARDEAEAVMYACLSAGLSFKIGQGNVLNLSPPLVISDAELDAAASILEAALLSVAAG